MDVTFANPLGLLALLGIPAVLAIHFFQRKTKRVEITTLFLLEDLTRESVRGSLFERIRNSPLLWLQLLAVLLLTWLLVQPMWLRAESVQQTIVVLDSSVSMRPFLGKLRNELRREINTLAGSATRSDWTVIESDTTRETVYSGGDASALLAAVAKWTPRAGHHDFAPALALARDLQRKNGILLLVSDRRPEALPAGIELLAIGHPVENCGFAGARVEVVSEVGVPPLGGPARTTNSSSAASRETKVIWSALLMNHGNQTVQRRYHLEAGTLKTPDEVVTLEPGGIRAIRGEIPRGEDRVTLALDPDEFPLDDTMPLLVPEPKLLTAIYSAPPELQPLVEKLAGTFEALARDTTGKPDFALHVIAANATGIPRDNSGIYFLYDPNPTGDLRPGLIAPDRHPWMNGLSWQGLLTRTGPSLSPTNTDRTLLWQGSHSLIFLREIGRTRQLVFNFDIAHANADRIPAFVLLIRRYIETIRTEKVALETRNVELHQPLEIAARLTEEPAELTFTNAPVVRVPVLAPGLATLRAPDEPGYFTITQGTRKLFEAAAHFADTREADLKKAASENTITPRARDLTMRNSQTDFLAPLWILLLTGTLLTTWAVAEGRRR